MTDSEPNQSNPSPDDLLGPVTRVSPTDLGGALGSGAMAGWGLDIEDAHHPEQTTTWLDEDTLQAVRAVTDVFGPGSVAAIENEGDTPGAADQVIIDLSNI